MHRSLLVVSMAAAMALAGGAQAQSTRNLYVGGAVGPSKFDFDTNSLVISGATASTFSVDDDSGRAVKIFGGWRFNPFFAAEVGLTDFGTFIATRRVTAPGTGTLRSEVSVAGLYLDAVGLVPIGGAVELFGKVGVIATVTAAERSTTGAVSLPADSGDDADSSAGLHAGVGMNVRITPRVWLRVEYERAFSVGHAALGEGDVSAFFLGASYRF
jgi:OmpA-OmpF porin, OOP family